MQQPDVISAITDCCDTIAKVSTGVKDVSPPRDLADHILSKTNLPFPAIEGITHIPPVREDGTISQVPGYDPVTRLFYNPPPGFQLPYVSDNPTGEEVREAVAIIDELLCDFPFDCPASKANAVALLLTSVIRSAIGGCVPLAVIDAPSPGSGKSLLASVVNIIATGMAAEFITAPKRDDEWKKSITAVLSDGSSIINIDNVTGTLESDDLASVLTTGRWKDRPFGSNTRTVSYPNRAVWVANGNNIDLGGDLPRRCYWIRLNSKCSKPHERVGFLHPNLVQWTRENRGQILWALLTLFRAWHVAGRPAADTPAMGSFEEWSRIVGSTLSFVGVEGFLVNKDLLWQNSSADQTDWEAFLTELFVKYPSSTDPLATKPVAVKQLVEMFGAENGFDGVIPQAVSFALHESNEPHGAVGLAFKKKAGRRFGEYGLHLEQGPDINHCHTWLVRADREGAGSQ
jgi:hypothetical protein